MSSQVNEKITPLPWRVERSDGVLDGKAKFETGSSVLIYSADCDIHPIADCSCNHTCRMEDEQEANAAYIVQACNAYPDLVAENERLRGVLEEAKKITDLYFAPWGAAKGAEWEFLSGDIPFTPENALRLIQRALSTEPARQG